MIMPPTGPKPLDAIVLRHFLFITFTRFQLLKNADFVLKKIIVICLKFNREFVMKNVKKT